MSNRSQTVDDALRMCRIKRTLGEEQEAFAARDREDLGRGSVVYFATKGRGCVKIGRTIDLAGRLAILRTADPCIELALSIPGGRKLEAELQAGFVCYGVGKEWFELSDEIKTFIDNGGKK